MILFLLRKRERDYNNKKIITKMISSWHIWQFYKIDWLSHRLPQRSEVESLRDIQRASLSRSRRKKRKTFWNLDELSCRQVGIAVDYELNSLSTCTFSFSLSLVSFTLLRNNHSERPPRQAFSSAIHSCFSFPQQPASLSFSRIVRVFFSPWENRREVLVVSRNE